MLSISRGRFVLPGNRWDLLHEMAPDEPPSVSVVIPYFQAQRQLDLVLTALSLQTHPLDRLEVIVADDGSATAPNLAAVAGLNVTVLRQEDRGFRPGAARNLGARHASGEVLCFLDNDTIPEPDYLRQLGRLPTLAPDAVVTGRRRHADLTEWTPARLEAWLTGGTGPLELEEPQWLIEEHHRTQNLLQIDARSYRYVISAVLACSRSIFGELGGFDESLVGYGGEDWEFAHRAHCAGAVFAHVPTAIAWHDGPSWAARGSTETRRREKNLETAALFARIPAGTKGVWTGRPAIALTIQISGEEAASVIIAVQHLLAADVDCGVWLVGDQAEDLKQTHFRHDGRVSAGAPTRSALSGTRTLVNMSRPLQIHASGWDLIGEGHVSGELLVTTADGTLTVLANAAYSRAKRWSDELPGQDVLHELSTRLIYAGDEVGVTAISRRPDLDQELSTRKEVDVN